MLFDETQKQPSLFDNIAPKEKEDWNTVKEESSHCKRCHLREGATQVVFGTGSIKSPFMMVGEGPGAQEDLEGEPFVGRAGQLLDRILKAINLNRNDVYITNVVKCRPPNNRQPSVEEMAVCKTWLEKEIKIVKPLFIVLLGATALKGLVEPGGKITRMRGQWLEKNGMLYMPTYHPAALLRDPSKKKPVWEDFKKIQQVLIKKEVGQ